MAPGPLAAALQSHDMFLYFGHGSGDQYLSARYILERDVCPVCKLCVLAAE